MTETACKCPDCSTTSLFKEGWCQACWDDDCRELFGGR